MGKDDIKDLNKVDFYFILRVIGEIKNDRFREEIDKIPMSLKSPLLFKVYSILPKKLKDEIINPFYKKYKENQKGGYFYPCLRTAYDIDFFHYILQNRDILNFNLDFFNEKDREEIIRYVRNKIYLVLNQKVELTKEDLDYLRRYGDLRKNIKSRRGNDELIWKGKRYILPGGDFRYSVFFHKYGVDEIPLKNKKEVKGTDFIDCGAFIGDSALVLDELKPRKIYSFEPVTDGYNKLLKTIKLNGLTNVVPVKKGVGDKNFMGEINSRSCESFISDLKPSSDFATESIEIVKIDDFAKKNDLNVGLIKMDVEGYELETMKGAEKTIKKYKPVLIISLYHTGKDFFEIPKLLKKWVPKYKYRFLNLDHTTPQTDMILVGYV